MRADTSTYTKALAVASLRLELYSLWHKYGNPTDLTDFCNRLDVHEVQSKLEKLTSAPRPIKAG